jgi:two-component system chemotaxis sensor kinase CheA
MESYLELFISETEDFIKNLNRELLVLESDTKRSPSILEVFRAFHSIKGMAQTMGFDDLATVSHRVEDLVAPAKQSGEIDVQLVNFLFIVADFLHESVQAIRQKKQTPPAGPIIRTIEKLERGEIIDIAEQGVSSKEISEIKVKMSKLDKLFNLTNELLITKSRLLKLSHQLGDQDIIVTGENASRLISSLQDEVMRLRMMPLSTVFEFFPRWLRDEAKREQKDVEFVMTGGEIEVDRSIIDVLKEPLMHLLRNALDHGIEHKGKITLGAYREKDRIRISVADNGKGIDNEEVRRLAVERKILSAEQAKIMPKNDVYKILIMPNFSTKKEVTAMSGRGIGLDIVNVAVTKLGGRLEITSVKGAGSTFTVELPLSLAIVRAMVFTLNDQRFALPLNYVKETFYIEPDSVKTIFHRELFPLRDEILPLVRVGEKLDGGSTAGRKSVIVVQYQNIKRGFIIDEIIDEEEVVVKKLDPLLPSTIYSGSSVYADGQPILIIDPRGFE